MYNIKYYHDETLWQLKPNRQAINTYHTIDGIIIGMFQGARGEFPEIDFMEHQSFAFAIQFPNRFSPISAFDHMIFLFIATSLSLIFDTATKIFGDTL